MRRASGTSVSSPDYPAIGYDGLFSRTCGGKSQAAIFKKSAALIIVAFPGALRGRRRVHSNSTGFDRVCETSLDKGGRAHAPVSGGRSMEKLLAERCDENWQGTTSHLPPAQCRPLQMSASGNVVREHRLNHDCSIAIAGRGTPSVKQCR